jgi:hypothetical protein
MLHALWLPEITIRQGQTSAVGLNIAVEDSSQVPDNSFSGT